MLTKAMLVDDAGGIVRFQFNPETIEFSSEANFPTEDATEDVQYTGPKPIELSLKMLLDEVTGTEPVVTRLETMLRWTREKEKGKKQPYVVTFSWGTLKIGSSVGLMCHCKSVSVKYELFNPGGVPIRALATVKLSEVPPKELGTNPTSGGELPARAQVLRSGDDLAVMTHREYGSTRNWRQIASRNGIDNPFRLPLGRELIFPGPLDLER